MLLPTHALRLRMANILDYWWNNGGEKVGIKKYYGIYVREIRDNEIGHWTPEYSHGEERRKARGIWTKF